MARNANAEQESTVGRIVVVENFDKAANLHAIIVGVERELAAWI